MSRLIAFLVVCLSALPASAGEKAKVNGLPPILVVLGTVDREKQEVGYSVLQMVTVPVTVTQTIMKDGKPVPVTVLVHRNEMRESSHRIDLAKSKIVTAAGKPLTPADALNTLKPGSPVLVSTNGHMIDGDMARALRPETLILIPPLMIEAPAPPKGDPNGKSS